MSKLGKRQLILTAGITILVVAGFSLTAMNLGIIEISNPINFVEDKSNQKVELFIISYETKPGYMDRSGKVVIKTQFDDVGFFSEELAPVEINNKWGFIDRTEKMVIEPRFEDLSGIAIFKNGLARLTVIDKNEEFKYAYIDKTGKYIWKSTNW